MNTVKIQFVSHNSAEEITLDLEFNDWAIGLYKTLSEGVQIGYLKSCAAQFNVVNHLNHLYVK